MKRTNINFDKLPHSNTVKKRFLEAYEVAATSPDTRTQVGVVLMSRSRKIIKACNTLTPGFTIDDPEYTTDKYAIMEHAERNAIFEAQRKNISLRDAILFSPWGSCADCARAIVASGISMVLQHHKIVKQSFPKWNHSIALGQEILDRGGVAVGSYTFDDLGGNPILMDGKLWQP